MPMPEKWFVGHSRPHVLGHTSWYGPWRTEEEAKAALPSVAAYWRKRQPGLVGYTYVERDDDSDVDYGELKIDA